MYMAWKEMKKNKARFLIVGAIVFLISLLTFIVSGLANGLSKDNVSLLKNMPEGTFYLSEESDESYTQSRIREGQLDEVSETFAFSIQMGAVKTASDTQQSVAFLTSSDTSLFPSVNAGEVILDSSLKEEGIAVGDKLSSPQFKGTFEVVDFTDDKRFNHSPVAFINDADFADMFRSEDYQIAYKAGANEEVEGLESFSEEEFLSSLPSYQAEQMTLTMIVWFLVVISGMLFTIFFYMMNVQKIGMYGILKALGIKTSALFRMIWSQMALITVSSLLASGSLSQVFQLIAPEAMPYHIPVGTIVQLSIVFIVVGFLGSTISGFQIRNMEPLKAIQQGDA
ncbi:ABC transporter permease [Halobacillus salinus]|uniref:ABC transporter permease n=1 Tax=Halobacillus salinus TaxID=192814 RepID=UPI0009A5C41B|nr:FtsX-like permease family protein [Halobacillus salinus]